MRTRLAVLSTMATCLLGLIGTVGAHAAEPCVGQGREAPFGAQCQPSVGVRLEAKDEYALDEEGEGCSDLIEYDAWATENPAESLPERRAREQNDFGQCSWPANGGATGLAGDKLLERDEWAAFAGLPADPDQGRLSVQVTMEPSCAYAGQSSPSPTFHEQCLAPGTIKEGKPVSVSKADYETMRANLQDSVKYWCGVKPSEENPSKGCKRKALEAPECKLEQEAKEREQEGKTGEGVVESQCNWAPFYRRQADNLISKREGNAYIRLGVEAEGNWYAWQYGPEPKAWREYYAKIVDTMDNEQETYDSQRTQENYAGHFNFVWVMGICPNTPRTLGGEPVSPAQAWPFELSPSRAPIVGVDFYPADGVRTDGREIRCYAAKDPGPKPTEPEAVRQWEEAMVQDWREGWENIEANDTWSLKHWAEFAKEKTRRLAMTQWAVTAQEDRGSDQSNFVFVRRLARFVFGAGNENPNDVVFSDYFNPEGPLPPVSPGAPSAQPQAAACYQFKFFANEKMAEKCPKA